MPRTEALDKAIKKYEKEKIDRLTLRLPKGKRELIQKCANLKGESVNAFINRAIEELMRRESKDK